MVYIISLLYYIIYLKMSVKQSRSSRGWSRVAPKTVGERSALSAKCGHRRCFLGPGKTFPVCARLGAVAVAGSRDCKVDRRGVAAAYSRAREWASITARKKRSSSKAASAHRRYTAVARRARAILSKSR